MPFVHFYTCQACSEEIIIPTYWHTWPVTCERCGHVQEHIRTYRNVLEIRQANKALGHHWFDKNTMSGFNSRVGDTVYHGRYFISSEAYNYGDTRFYNIRYANDNGSIDTVKPTMTYTSHRQALTALEKHIRTLTEKKVSTN